MTHGRGNPIKPKPFLRKKLRRRRRPAAGILAGDKTRIIRPKARRKARKSKKQVGPPKVSFRTVKGRRGKLITIKRPRPRSA